MAYTTQQRVAGSFDDVVDATVDALGDEGFGVLCDIDVQATFAKKLDEEFRQYRILGACNPGLAREGLDAEIELGALLPCNVIVYESEDETGGEDGAVTVSAVDPAQLVGIADNPALESIATDVSGRFERVLDAIDDEFESPVEA
ncbi:protein of unknown function DUF302 [Halomicrobium zhouii]|uniref:DUF302 domain-containing protein n=1 Tax=Halomicrobium zhouii TaxID=767519 RepID=A0A1I6M3D8_9EURY|nr:DUF302 domain-containing protein [Halomicrobium zhouii]SFS10191.1 protein of unknown function DUF302 [Halomicrobium zhouii]